MTTASTPPLTTDPLVQLDDLNRAIAQVEGELAAAGEECQAAFGTGNPERTATALRNQQAVEARRMALITARDAAYRALQEQYVPAIASWQVRAQETVKGWRTEQAALEREILTHVDALEAAFQRLAALSAEREPARQRLEVELGTIVQSSPVTLNVPNLDLRVDPPNVVGILQRIGRLLHDHGALPNVLSAQAMWHR